MCDKVGDCADGLKILHRRLERAWAVGKIRSVAKMAEKNEPKRKYNIWGDNGEVKIIDMGYDYHTNVPTQMIVRSEVAKNGRKNDRA
jgi:hypothetical protein